MATPSVKIRDRKRMLVDQNAKDMALCIKEMSNLEREMYHYCNSVVFLDIKAVARTSQDVDHRKGNLCKQILQSHDNL